MDAGAKSVGEYLRCLDVQSAKSPRHLAHRVGGIEKRDLVSRAHTGFKGRGVGPAFHEAERRRVADQLVPLPGRIGCDDVDCDRVRNGLGILTGGACRVKYSLHAVVAGTFEANPLVQIDMNRHRLRPDADSARTRIADTSMKPVFPKIARAFSG